MVPLEELIAGVYQCRRGTDVIRVLVAGQLPQTEENAPLHLFSGAKEQVKYGMQHYRRRSADVSSLFLQLLTDYQQEGLSMSYTMEDFRRDFARMSFKELTPEERRLALASLSEEQRQQMLADLSTKEKQELLAGLSVEEIEQYLKRRKKGSPSPKKRR